MYINNNLLLIILRIIILFLIWYYINFRLSKKAWKHNVFDFIVKKGFVYGSLLVFSSFILLVIGIYDFLNVLIILGAFGLLTNNRFKSPKYITSSVFNNIKQFLLISIKRAENGNFIAKTFFIQLTAKQKGDLIVNILMLFLIIGISFWSRTYFFQFDQYTFSDLWFKNVDHLSDIENQKWLLNNNQLFGNFICIDFLSKISQQISEVSLYSFGNLVSVAISVVLYWAVYSIGNTKKTVALITALLFATCYRFLPINMSFISQNSEVLLALLLVLPLMVYVLKPKLLNENKFFLYSFLFVSLFAVASINVFVFIIIVFPLLVLLILLGNQKQRLTAFISLTLFSFVSIIFITVYKLNGVDVILFIKSNLIAVSSYTQIPHLLFPLKVLLHGVQLVSFIALTVVLIFNWLKKDNNRAITIVLIFYNFLVIINSFELIIIDSDLLVQVFLVFIPLTLGLSLAVLTRLLKPILKNQVYLKRYVLPLSAVTVTLWISIISNKSIVESLKPSNQFASKTLSVYNNIAKNYLPYSYAVVNDRKLQSFSSQKHYYLSFEDFNDYYLKKDKLYHAFRFNEDILKKNPELVLPKTILLFVYKDKNEVNDLGLHSSTETLKLTEQKLASLKEKNRATRLFYENDVFKVIEIINEPSSSKISELMMY